MSQPIKKIMLQIFQQLQEIFIEPKRDDETDDEADSETNDHEQPDTTNITDLESEESAEQKVQGLKILKLNKILTKLPVSLAQLEAENNSEKLTIEIRQPLYSLYRSKKLSKTIYKYLINTT